MGYYVNPPTEPKESWLLRHGEQVATPTWPAPSGKVIVCLVNNGRFRAAAIIFDEHEYQDFLPSADDQRPREWYLVPRDKVLGVCPQVQGILESPR